MSFLLAIAVSLAAGLISGVVTARLLGPHDRGVYSTFIVFVGLTTQIATAGLGDASVYFIKSRRDTMARAAPRAVAAALLFGFAGAALVPALAVFAVGSEATTVRLLASAAAVGTAVPVAVLSSILIAAGRVRRGSLVYIVNSVTLTISLMALLTLTPHGIAAALAAQVPANVIAIWLLVRFLGVERVTLVPTLDWDYVRRALLYGVPVQTGLFLTFVAGRSDLLLVFLTRGASEAGYYSVALTLAFVASAAAVSVTHSVFPRLPALEPYDARFLVGRCVRMGLAATLIATPILLIGAALGIPLIFGREYASAVGPGLLLVLSGALTGMQWLLGRLATARGLTHVLPVSFLAFVVTMLSFDALAVPAYGLVAAGLGSVLGASVGLAVAGIKLRRVPEGQLTLQEITPAPRDFWEVLSVPAELLARSQHAR
ncbi:MAG TPA: oligosaccharide flippase family protein [Vicinamibacterales bacterium]|nr:oligosaccharide flippase family protein [Vicinamibacterales bacterium]